MIRAAAPATEPPTPKPRLLRQVRQRRAAVRDEFPDQQPVDLVVDEPRLLGVRHRATDPVRHDSKGYPSAHHDDPNIDALGRARP